mmetsp:Transcript_33471/g.87835  ORF Transcript_33471/g.87835 Transcript_33471/m.87835 type:complete len:215 (-) Transcript_33471:1723-2367(-)
MTTAVLTSFDLVSALLNAARAGTPTAPFADRAIRRAEVVAMGAPQTAHHAPQFAFQRTRQRVPDAHLAIPSVMAAATAAPHSIALQCATVWRPFTSPVPGAARPTAIANDFPSPAQPASSVISSALGVAPGQVRPTVGRARQRITLAPAWLRVHRDGRPRRAAFAFSATDSARGSVLGQRRQSARRAERSSTMVHVFPTAQTAPTYRRHLQQSV